jgi:hypothetical protein
LALWIKLEPANDKEGQQSIEEWHASCFFQFILNSKIHNKIKIGLPSVLARAAFSFVPNKHHWTLEKTFQRKLGMNSILTMSNTVILSSSSTHLSIKF